MKEIILAFFFTWSILCAAIGQQDYGLAWEKTEAIGVLSGGNNILLTEDGAIFTIWTEDHLPFNTYCFMYDEFGQKIWESEIPTPFEATGGASVGAGIIGETSEGDILIGIGVHNISLYKNAIVFVKFSAEGEKLWQSTYQYGEPINTCTEGNSTNLNSVVLDNNNGFYIIGNASIETPDSYVYTKYIAQLNTDGEKILENGYTGWWGSFTEFNVHSDTMLYYSKHLDTITQYSISITDGVPFDSTGVHFSGLSNGNSYYTQLDQEENLYLGGRYELFKYNQSLEEVWHIEREVIPDRYYFGKLLFDEEQKMYVLGATHTSGTNFIESFFINKLDSNGDVEWEVQHTFQSDIGEKYFYDAFIIEDNHLFFVVNKYLSQDDQSILLFKYDTTGTEIASVSYDNTEISRDLFYGIAVSDEGDIYLSGQADYSVPFLLKYSILTGLDDIENTLNCKITPNPFSDKILIDIKDDKQWEEVEINLYDMQGKSILKEKRLGNALEVKIEGIPVGIYQLEVKKGDLRCVKKVVHQ